jgi:hypothetical protein
MAHGDDGGLRLPPALAPIQVVLVVIKDECGASEHARRLAAELAARGTRVELDDRTDVSFGRRVTDWELKGVPVRVEIGPRDLANQEMTLFCRATNAKSSVSIARIAERVDESLGSTQRCLHRPPSSATTVSSLRRPSKRPPKPRATASPGSVGPRWDLTASKGLPKLALRSAAYDAMTAASRTTSATPMSRQSSRAPTDHAPLRPSATPTQPDRRSRGSTEESGSRGSNRSTHWARQAGGSQGSPK